MITTIRMQAGCVCLCVSVDELVRVGVCVTLCYVHGPALECQLGHT